MTIEDKETVKTDEKESEKTAEDLNVQQIDEVLDEFVDKNNKLFYDICPDNL